MLRVLTTASRSAEEAVLPAGDWIEVDPDAEYRSERLLLDAPDRPPSSAVIARLVRTTRHPIRTVRLRRLTRRRPALSRATQRNAVRAVVDQMTTTGQPAELLAVDVEDVLLVERLLGPDVRLFGGTLRGLGDRWDAAAHRTGDAAASAEPGMRS